MSNSVYHAGVHWIVQLLEPLSKFPAVINTKSSFGFIGLFKIRPCQIKPCYHWTLNQSPIIGRIQKL